MIEHNIIMIEGVLSNIHLYYMSNLICKYI